MKITLVGYMASGKTLTGKALSEALRIPFIDLDKTIEEKTKMSISEMISTKSELAFRKVEREVLKEVLDLPSFVLSAGGGTPCYYNNMDEIVDKSHAIYIQESPKILTQRLIEEKAQRPLVSNVKDEDMLEFVAKHLFERRAFYEKAQFTVKGDDKLNNILNQLKQID